MAASGFGQAPSTTQGAVVLLYTSEEPPTPPPAPWKLTSIEGYRRVFVPITTGEPLRVLRKRLRAYAEPLPNRVLLHPWNQNSVVQVAKSWREGLRGENLFRDPNAEYISFEIGDDWNTFLPFVDQERML